MEKAKLKPCVKPFRRVSFYTTLEKVYYLSIPPSLNKFLMQKKIAKLIKVICSRNGK